MSDKEASGFPQAGVRLEDGEIFFGKVPGRHALLSLFAVLVCPLVL
jgi:hypothetical protein